MKDRYIITKVSSYSCFFSTALDIYARHYNSLAIRSAFPIRTIIQSNETKASSITKTPERKQIPSRLLNIVISSDVGIFARLSVKRLENM